MQIMRKYGVPYKGSKTKLADWIIDILPQADTLVDLFAGGCAITHAALLSGKWNNIIMNDADPRGMRLFLESIHGKHTVASHPEWISRETFNMLKDTDSYVGICWSFGNNMRDYLYGKKIEEYKKSIWDMCHGSTVYEIKVRYRRCVHFLQEIISKRLIDDRHLAEIDSLDRLINLERLQSLDGLQSLNGLQSLEGDYRLVKIPQDAVVYCDPPYQNTNKYSKDINYKDFVEWCNSQTVPVYVSSYQIGGLHLLAEHEHRSILSAKANIKVIERIFGNDAAYQLFQSSAATR